MATFIAFTLLLLLLRFGGTASIIKYLPGARNGAAFLVALASAYAFSIAFGNIWGPVVGRFAPSFVPIIAGIVYGFGFYAGARNLATRPMFARSAYFAIGLLAVLAGLVGHKHNFFVGASLLILSLVLPFDIPVASRQVTLARN